MREREESQSSGLSSWGNGAPCAEPREPVRYTHGFCFDLWRVAVGIRVLVWI